MALATAEPLSSSDAHALAAQQASQTESAAEHVDDSAANASGRGRVRESVSRFASVLRSAVAESPSWLTSMVVHGLFLVVLAVLTVPMQLKELSNLVVTAPGKGNEAFDDFPLDGSTGMQSSSEELAAGAPAPTADPLALAPVTADFAAAPSADFGGVADFGVGTAAPTDLLQSGGGIGGVSGLEGVGSGSGKGSGLAGRGPQARVAMVRERGGNDASERAVALSLIWLAEHQMPDGGWNFDHRLGSCQGRCGQFGGAAEARRAATAMALMPFLGAGQTHKEGKYKNTVSRGLFFLMKSMQFSPLGGSFYEKHGRLYSHGLGSIAICEAYAMTRDRDLFEPARLAITFICRAQDQVGGGWRYEVGQPGDTSVVGWQLMALKSAHMAYLDVPKVTVQRANLFLDTVQKPDGGYGYTDNTGGSPATTAVGLLCRMYLGWKHDHPQLKAGVAYLDKLGPDPNNMYYNYYATQVMHHYEGDEWKRWNKKMRDHLVTTQAMDGHERGSWFFNDPHGAAMGGRLYSTALGAMVLEVYYRHMPIYGKESTENEFPD